MTLGLSSETLTFVIGLDAQPALRNRLITQSYHNLSSELARVLGGPDVNWCTFATWASATAGTFIRDEEVPSLFRRLLVESRGFRGGAERLSKALFGAELGSELASTDPFGLAEHVIRDVRTQITLGNLAVFSELAPIFYQLIQCFDGGSFDARRGDRVLTTLRAGPSSANGQTLLRDAFEEFMRAAMERDGKKRAEHMLLANALTGLHEQIRLQPYIAESLDAPVGDVLGKLWAAHTQEPKHESLLDRLHSLWDRVGNALVHEADQVWSGFATDVLMTLAVPGQVLRLGHALPPPQAAPLYPSDLQKLGNEDAVELLTHYDALDPRSLGDVGAEDWTALAQRMRYILALFRSRQVTRGLLAQPFSAAEEQEIASAAAELQTQVSAA